MKPEDRCARCDGTGWVSCGKDAAMEGLPFRMQPLGVFQCPSCNGRGFTSLSEEEKKAFSEAVKDMKSPERLS
jgi:hypothetical protein